MATRRWPTGIYNHEPPPAGTSERVVPDAEGFPKTRRRGRRTPRSSRIGPSVAVKLVCTPCRCPRVLGFLSTTAIAGNAAMFLDGSIQVDQQQNEDRYQIPLRYDLDYSQVIQAEIGWLTPFSASIDGPG